MQMQSAVPNDAPGVILLAIGPMVQGKRMPPIFRLRHADQRFYIENKHGTGAFGRWKAMGHAVQLQAAIQGMTDLNNRELAKHGLRQW